MRNRFFLLPLGMLLACTGCPDDDAAKNAGDAAGPPPANGVFTAASFDEATRQAAGADKLVFIDFYATWCGPCKVFDSTTLKDETVVAWLAEHTVAVKIDVDQENELAARYNINVLPTLLFCKPDGTEAGRVVGASPAKAFLAEAKQIRAGRSSLEIARGQLKAAGENDPVARMQYADQLALNGKSEEALKEYLWCYDEGVKLPMFAAMRNTFLLPRIAGLGEVYAPAMDALRERRDAAEKRLLDSKGKRSLWGMLTGRPVNPAEDYAALNRVLGQSDRTLAMFDRLTREAPDSQAVLTLQSMLFDEFRRTHRYADVADIDQIEARIDDDIKIYTTSDDDLPAEVTAEMKAEIRELEVRMLIQDIAGYYEVLIGIEADARAAAVAERALSIDESAETYNELAWAGYLTGAPIEANVIQARKAYELSHGRSMAIVDTLVRVLHARGDNDEACTVLAEAAGRKLSTRDRLVLEDLQADMACP